MKRVFAVIVLGCIAVGGFTCASRTNRDAGMAGKTQLDVASEIQSVVRRYLRADVVEARRNLPSDLAHLLPTDAQDPVQYPPPGGGLSLPPWRLEIEGDHAKLTYVPPGGINANVRLWFQLNLERRGGAWSISPPGVEFGQAHARKPPDR